MVKFNKENQLVKSFQFKFNNYFSSKSFLLILIIMLSGNFLFLNAENADSSKINILNNFSLSVSGCHIWHSIDYDNQVVMPKYTSVPEFIINYYDYSKPQKINRDITDNPLFHGATLINFDVGFKSNGFTISANILAEHRGISYGVYNTDAMIIYPKYKLGFDSSLTIFGEKFNTGVFIGNQDNFKRYEGLTLYNIDGQGPIAYLKYKYFKFEYHKIGDLVNYIGLNIDDADDYMLSAEEINIFGNFLSDIRIGIYKNIYYGYGNMSGYNFSINLHNNNVKLYSQLSYRNSDYVSNFAWQSAFLAGANYKLETKKYSLDFTGEYRYYGYYFNWGFVDYTISYRPKEPVYDTLNKSINYQSTSEYDKTIGENLYPLNFYDRPFSQWAVYTEYQGKNVIGIVFQLKGQYYFYDKFMVKTNLDFNCIKASYLPDFWYMFYDLGIGYEPVKNNYIFISMTNKAMNLDKHYPTFYMMEWPELKLSLYFDVKLITGGSK